MFPRFCPSRVGREEIDGCPIFHNQTSHANTQTARIRIFASTTSTSVFASSRSAPRLLKIVDQFAFADASRGDQCV